MFLPLIKPSLPVSQAPKLGTLIGTGTRRICYADRADPHLCYKLMRSSTDPALTQTVKQELLYKATHWRSNTNCAEFLYMDYLRQSPHLRAYFPPVFNLLDTKTHGYVLHQSLLRDFTGDLSRQLTYVFNSKRGRPFQKELLQALHEMADSFCKNKVLFFDFYLNVMVHWLDESHFELIIIDVDPIRSVKSFVAYTICPWLLRRRIRREVNWYSNYLITRAPYEE